jgi:exopolysaccharide biosynthesis polyprenyl glycosylphosphotransferase
MIETRISIYNGLSMIMDVLAVLAAFVSAMVYASAIPYIIGTDGLTYLNLRVFAALALALVMLEGAHIVSFVLYHSLRSPFSAHNRLYHILLILGFLVLDCCIVQAACWVMKAPILPWKFLWAYGVVFLSGVLILRTMFQTLMAWSYTLKGNNLHVLIVGTNQRAYDFFKFMQSNRSLGYTVVGFLDDHNQCGEDDVHLIAPLSEFAAVARKHVLDAVILFLPMRGYYDTIISIIEDSRVQGIPVQHMYYSLFDQKQAAISPSRIGGHAGLSIPNGPVGIMLMAGKRLFDIVFSLTALILTQPLLLTAAVAIKIEDGGPVLYTQSRVGYRKRTFSLLKLRTMVVEAEKLMPQLEQRNEMDGPVFKMKNDPRVTRVGRLLRKYHLDELPQFVNVILGDMSVVGPRPMAERDYRGFSEDWLRRRFSVRPGLTCTWQTLPDRNDIPFAQWMKMDMDYTENWSFWLDVRIICRTVLTILMGTGR